MNTAMLTVLGLVGTAISAYVWNRQISAGPVWCIGTGCAGVIRSRYGRLLGIPNGALGTAFFLYIAFLPLLRRSSPALDSVAIAVTSVALLLFLYLTYLQLFVLRTLCSWCLTSAAITAAIFVLLIIAP